MIPMTLFYSKDHPFSNHYPCTFVVKDITFQHGEQFMMYCKAMFFGDVVTAKLILAEKSPQACKILGRRVTPFDEEAWYAHVDDWLVVGAVARFYQNPKECRQLMQSAGTELVEASPYDTIWGVGLAEDDPRVHDRSQWRGQNRWGKILMRAREKLYHMTQFY